MQACNKWYQASRKYATGPEWTNPHGEVEWNMQYLEEFNADDILDVHYPVERIVVDHRPDSVTIQAMNIWLFNLGTKASPHAAALLRASGSKTMTPERALQLAVKFCQKAGQEAADGSFF